MSYEHQSLLTMPEGQILLFGSSKDGVMTGTNKIVTEWVRLKSKNTNLLFEILYTGSPVGSFSVEAKLAGPATDLGLPDLPAPDGTSYTGSLDAADLTAEDLGHEIVSLNIGRVYVRLAYTNASGTGTVNVRATTTEV